MAADTALRILLIEDDAEDARIFCRYAAGSTAYQVEVDHVTTSAQALQRLAEAEYHLAFLDLRLGEGLTGLELLERIRAAQPDIPVIILTATGNEQAAAETMKSGAVDYLLKDAFNCDTLERCVRHALEQRRFTMERRQAEEKLRESEARFRTLFSGIPEGVIVHDEDGKILHINDVGAQRLEWPAAELVGRNLREIVTPENAALVADHARRTLTQGSDTFETTYVSRSGRHIEAEVNECPISFEGKDAILSVGRDITERKRAEEENRRLQARIHEAQKLESLGVLAGGIAHDFNNLLTGVLGNASLAVTELPCESPARVSIQRIVEAARRAADLSHQMLAYSGKGRFVIQPVDLSRLVADMAHLLETAISKNAVLKYDFADDLPAVEADAAQLRQVVMNLITNASEAVGDESGAITLHTGVTEVNRHYLSTTRLGEGLPEGAYVYVEVCDTGSGMDEETKQRIFDPFFTTKFAGRGLGLAAVLGIVRGHRGTIEVCSQPGRGTSFKVFLPPCDAPAVDMREEQEAPPTEWQGTGTILVVDDEEAVRTVAKIALERSGFTVLTAKDGREGVEVFRQHAGEIAVVLLDLTMPHMGGKQTLTELRRIRDDVPVILFSGYNEEDALSRFAGNRLAGFIQKPYDPNTLIPKVREAMQG